MSVESRTAIVVVAQQRGGRLIVLKRCRAGNIRQDVNQGIDPVALPGPPNSTNVNFSQRKTCRKREYELLVKPQHVLAPLMVLREVVGLIC